MYSLIWGFSAREIRTRTDTHIPGIRFRFWNFMLETEGSLFQFDNCFLCLGWGMGIIEPLLFKVMTLWIAVMTTVLRLHRLLVNLIRLFRTILKFVVLAHRLSLKFHFIRLPVLIRGGGVKLLDLNRLGFCCEHVTFLKERLHFLLPQVLFPQKVFHYNLLRLFHPTTTKLFPYRLLLLLTTPLLWFLDTKNPFPFTLLRLAESYRAFDVGSSARLIRNDACHLVNFKGLHSVT